MDREKLQKALTEYDRISNAAQAEYNKISKAALTEYDKISNAAWAEYNKISKAAQAECDRRRKAAWAEESKISDAAWEGIAKAVDDPLVSWIIKECTGYESKTLEILRMLPASLCELDEYALDAGWCREWTEFRTKALKAGVITEN